MSDPQENEIPGVRITPTLPEGAWFLRNAYRQRVTPFGVIRKLRDGGWGYWAWQHGATWLYGPPLVTADTYTEAIELGMVRQRELRLGGR